MGTAGQKSTADLDSDVCQEARLTLDQQISKIEKSDQKAMTLFRSNILLLGLILTALSIIVHAEGVQVNQFINNSSIFGIISLSLSTFLAAMAYTSSSIDTGISTSEIRKSEAKGYGVENWRSDLKESYIEGMEHNSNVGSYNANLITWTIIFAFSSMLFLMGGTFIGALSLKNTNEAMVVFVIVFVASMGSGLGIYYADDIFTKIYN